MTSSKITVLLLLLLLISVSVSVSSAALIHDPQPPVTNPVVGTACVEKNVCPPVAPSPAPTSPPPPDTSPPPTPAPTCPPPPTPSTPAPISPPPPATCPPPTPSSPAISPPPFPWPETSPPPPAIFPPFPFPFPFPFPPFPWLVASPPPPALPWPPSPPPPPSTDRCPIDILKMGACVDLFGGMVHIGLGDPVIHKCCPMIAGLIEIEAAVCLCTTLRIKALNLNLYIPIALEFLVHCGKTPPPGYNCLF